MTTQSLQKLLIKKMQAISKKYTIDNWATTQIEDMHPIHAFDRAYYRACKDILNELTLSSNNK